MLNYERSRVYRSLGFIGPGVLYLLVVSIIPLGYSVWLAFHNWSIMTRVNPPYVGWDNFGTLFSDERLWYSLQLTAVYGIATIALELVLGTGAAMLLSRTDLRGLRLVRSIALLPVVVAPLAAGYTFRLMLHSNVGPVNYLLGLIGIGPVQWLSDPTAAFAAIIIVTLWQWLPFSTLVVFSGLQSIPNEYLEAARVDGASRLQMFIRIILPLLVPVMLVVVLIRSMEVFKMFDLVFVLTGGGPGNSTELASLYTYKVGFSAFNLGYAAAISWVLLLIVVIVSQVLLRVVLRRGVWEGI